MLRIAPQETPWPEVCRFNSMDLCLDAGSWDMGCDRIHFSLQCGNSGVQELDLLVEISGVFVKIAFADDVDKFLLRGNPKRPAGRFNRPAQDALYLSVTEESARTALIKYIKNNDPPRVLVEYEVEACRLVDLRSPGAIDLYTSSRGDWHQAIDKGNTPTSWKVADSIRKMGHVGLIDPSRKKPELWHITLFRWNEAGAPAVIQRGKPIPICIDQSEKVR